MSTHAPNTVRLREAVRAAADGLRGTVWPNGLGFDARGWSFRIGDDGRWSASHAGTARMLAKYAVASSPVTAKAKALGYGPERPDGSL